MNDASDRQSKPQPFSDADFLLVYDQLRREAARQKQNFDLHTITATAVVHEAYVRLAEDERFRAWSRTHLFWAVVKVMRRLLVDQVRRKAAIKRGGGAVPIRFVLLHDEAASAAIDPEEILAINLAMHDLAVVDPEAEDAFELWYFGGLTHAEIARVTGCSTKTVGRRLDVAKAFIAEALGAQPRSNREAGDDAQA